jgi:hypothetical protein
VNSTEVRHFPAAFINNIAEEGTKEEAIQWLQKIWNQFMTYREDVNTQNEQLLVELKTVREQVQQLITAGLDTSRRSPQSAHEDLEHGPSAWMSPVERELRKLLAFRCSEPGALYGDDGELHDSTMPFPIDYMRDSIDMIRHQLEQRGLAKLGQHHKQLQGLCSHERCFRFAGHKDEHTDLDGRPL